VTYPQDTDSAGAPRFKVVTRTYWANPSEPFSRDTRHLTRDELSSYLRAIQVDADEFGTHGTVHVDGKPYAAFERHWQGISRCPVCTVKHFSRCLSAPDPSTCKHEFTIRTSLPNKLFGAVHSWSPYRECRLCGRLTPEEPEDSEPDPFGNDPAYVFPTGSPEPAESAGAPDMAPIPLSAMTEGE
jgi:hypothetical protein